MTTTRKHFGSVRCRSEDETLLFQIYTWNLTQYIIFTYITTRTTPSLDYDLYVWLLLLTLADSDANKELDNTRQLSGELAGLTLVTLPTARRWMKGFLNECLGPLSNFCNTVISPRLSGPGWHQQKCALAFKGDRGFWNVMRRIRLPYRYTRR